MSELLLGILAAVYFGRLLMGLAVFALVGIAWRHMNPRSRYRFDAHDAATLGTLLLIAAAFAAGFSMEMR